MARFFEAHRATLDKAVAAAAARTFWSAYPEAPSGKIYGETAKADGEAAFKAMLGKPFDLGQGRQATPVGKETSPWGLALGISYAAASVDELIAASQAAGKDVGARRRSTTARACAWRSCSASTGRAS